MNRNRIYRDGAVTVQGWRLLIDLAEKVLGSPAIGVNATIYSENGNWGHKAIEDFLADVAPGRNDVWLYYTPQNNVSLHLHDNNGYFSWDLIGATKPQIVSFERDAESVIKGNWISSPPRQSKPTVLFIGHGRATDWRDLKDHLHDKHGVRIVAYETGARAGHTIRDILKEMLDNSSLAILVHTPEDELADGTFNSRPNVIHETGLFQGRLGFARAIVLLKHGTSEFSNLAGIQQIRYTDIRETFGEVLAWMKRETEAA